MRIITQNIKGIPLLAPCAKKRLKIFLKKVKECNADIACVQEVYANYLIPICKKELGDEYTVIYKKGTLFPAGGLLVITKLPVETFAYTAFTKVGNNFDETLSDKLVGKGFLHVVLQSGEHIIATHLTSNYNQDFKKGSQYEIQKTQLGELVSYITKNLNPRSKLMCVGDFNIPPNCDLFTGLLDKIQVSDYTHNIGATYHGYTTKVFGKVIKQELPMQFDYILGTGFEIRKSEIVPAKEYSDHDGILLDFNKTL